MKTTTTLRAAAALLACSATTTAAATAHAQNLGFIPPSAEEAKGSSVFLFQDQVGAVFNAEHALLRAKKYNVWGLDRSVLWRAIAQASPAYTSANSWTGRNCVTGVRNQGATSTCWAFAGTAALESAWCMEFGNVVDAAEQSILECRTVPNDAARIGGGWEGIAYDIMRSQGLDDQSRRAFTPGTYAACTGPVGLQNFYGIDGSTYVPAQAATGLPSVDDIKRAIVDSGAVTTMVTVTEPFDLYSVAVGPIVTTQADLDDPIGNRGLHEVALVGWNDELGAWRFKNSWDVNWADDNGFGWISYGDIALGGGNVSHVTPANKWNAADRARIFATIAIRLFVMPKIWGDNPYVQFPSSLGFPRQKMKVIDGFKWAIANALVSQSEFNRWPANIRTLLR